MNLTKSQSWGDRDSSFTILGSSFEAVPSDELVGWPNPLALSFGFWRPDGTEHRITTVIFDKYQVGV